MSAHPIAQTGSVDADATNVAVVPESRHRLRTGFGVFLFVGWGILTILWVASTVYLAAHGSVSAVITAVSALSLLLLLGTMEGLEVSVIDRWQNVWPGREAQFLARWLASRQLFVAMIVTAATLLADRSIVVVPFTSVKIHNGFLLGLFDLLWTTLTVLWFAQIFWKELGATNPDRYIALLKRVLFPLVNVVHRLGISLPGEWTATFVERRLDWSASVEELLQGASAQKLTQAEIWRALGTAHPHPPVPPGQKPS